MSHLDVAIERLEALAETKEFNGRHMIAEDTLSDAWAMLEMAKDQFLVDANSLRFILNELRAARSEQ